MDTIAAIATSVGESGIGIVRLSGQTALKIAAKIFRAKEGENPSSFKAFTLHYGWVVDGQGSIVDEALLGVMRAPRSYTREDTIEINCHGGIAPLRKTLELVLEHGARLAEPGEFTKRAFLNGRIDLAQAEAVLDIIRAKSDAALEAGLQQLKGGLSSRVNEIRGGLLEILAELEAGIDFPGEEGTGAHGLKAVAGKLKRVGGQLESLLENAGYGRILREGLRVVICGRPNVGKSSLLNALLRQERSIVTATPGTTRDTIEEVINLKGIPVRLVDTAGILKPRGIIERKAVGRARRQIAAADLAILLFDGSQKLTREDKIFASRLKGKVVLAAINKIDKRQRLGRREIAKIFPRVVEISAKKNRHIGLLEQAICELAYAGKVRMGEPAAVTNLRHIQALKDAQKLIAEALDSLDNGLSAEFISQDLKEAVGFLDELLGRRLADDLLELIFSEFCI